MILESAKMVRIWMFVKELNYNVLFVGTYNNNECKIDENKKHLIICSEELHFVFETHKEHQNAYSIIRKRI